MEGFMIEFKEMKDAVRELKLANEEMKTKIIEATSNYSEEIQSLKEVHSKQNDQIELLRRENISLQELIKASQCRESEQKETGNTKMTSADWSVQKGQGNGLTLVEMEKVLGDMKQEFHEGLMKMQDHSNRMQESSSKIDEMERAFNLSHVSLQTRKELEKEVESLKTEMATMKRSFESMLQAQKNTALKMPAGNIAGAAPATSSEQLSKIDADVKRKSCFRVYLNGVTLPLNFPVWIERYNKVQQHCDFMDPVSGIYTVPKQGNYYFDVNAKCVLHSTGDIYLCKDRGDIRKKLQLSYENRVHSYLGVQWSCLENDKVWVEIVSFRRTMDVFEGVVFMGRML